MYVLQKIVTENYTPGKQVDILPSFCPVLSSSYVEDIYESNSLISQPSITFYVKYAKNSQPVRFNSTSQDF